MTEHTFSDFIKDVKTGEYFSHCSLHYIHPCLDALKILVLPFNYIDNSFPSLYLNKLFPNGYVKSYPFDNPDYCVVSSVVVDKRIFNCAFVVPKNNQEFPYYGECLIFKECKNQQGALTIDEVAEIVEQCTFNPLMESVKVLSR